MNHLIASDHAIQRARERAGWNRHSLCRMLERIFYHGIDADCPSKRVRQYLSHLPARAPGRFGRIYGDFLFVFAHGFSANEFVLVTLHRTPPDIRAVATHARHEPWAA